jgi:hypothetical protein
MNDLALTHPGVRARIRACVHIYEPGWECIQARTAPNTSRRSTKQGTRQQASAKEFMLAFMINQSKLLLVLLVSLEKHRSNQPNGTKASRCPIAKRSTPHIIGRRVLAAMNMTLLKQTFGGAHYQVQQRTSTRIIPTAESGWNKRGANMQTKCRHNLGLTRKSRLTSKPR